MTARGWRWRGRSSRWKRRPARSSARRQRTRRGLSTSATWRRGVITSRSRRAGSRGGRRTGRFGDLNKRRWRGRGGGELERQGRGGRVGGVDGERDVWSIESGAGGGGAAGGAGDVDDRGDAAAEGAGGGATEVGSEAAVAGHISALSCDVRAERGAADGGAEVPPRVQDPGGSGDAAGHGDRRGNPAGAEQIPGVRAGGGRLREAVRGAIYQPHQRRDDSPCDPAGGLSPGPAVFLQGHGEVQVASVVLDLDGVRVQGR